MLPDEVEAHDSRYRWVEIGELLHMLDSDYLVNTDARSVLTCWLFTDSKSLQEINDGHAPFLTRIIHSLSSKVSYHSSGEITQWMESLSDAARTETSKISLGQLDEKWRYNDWHITSPENPSLSIHHIAVQCSSREVHSWDQPIAGSRTTAFMLLIMGQHQGTVHLLLQAALEAGNRNGFELTTTIQADSRDKVDETQEKYVRTAEEAGKTILTFQNSEEGGRFDKCVSLYQIVWFDEVSGNLEGPFHRWVSLAQFSEFLLQENRITNELRSAVSALLSGNYEQP
jgi:oxidase EvaA